MSRRVWKVKVTGNVRKVNRSSETVWRLGRRSAGRRKGTYLLGRGEWPLKEGMLRILGYTLRPWRPSASSLMDWLKGCLISCRKVRGHSGTLCTRHKGLWKRIGGKGLGCSILGLRKWQKSQRQETRNEKAYSIVVGCSEMKKKLIKL